MYIKSFIFSACMCILVGCSNQDHPQYSGYVEGENIYLASPFSGILQQLAVNRGQHVTKDDLLFVLDPKPQSIFLKQAEGEMIQAREVLKDLKLPRRVPEISAIEAQIEQTNAQISLAEIRVDRYQKLFDKQASDRDSLDAALANLQQQKELKLQYESNLALAKLGSRENQISAQQAQFDTLQAKLKAAQWDLEQKTLRAPATGVIFDTYYRPGEFVNERQPVLSLLTPENIHIEFFVPLDYLNRLKVGDHINFSCQGCDEENAAVIHYISPDAEYLPPLVYSRDNKSRLVFRIKAHISTKPERFKPGQPVMVTL